MQYLFRLGGDNDLSSVIIVKSYESHACSKTKKRSPSNEERFHPFGMTYRKSGLADHVYRIRYKVGRSTETIGKGHYLSDQAGMERPEGVVCGRCDSFAIQISPKVVKHSSVEVVCDERGEVIPVDG